MEKINLEEWKEKLFESLEKIEEISILVNKAMTEFMQSDALKRLDDLICNLPNDVQKTQLVCYVKNLYKKEISYEDVKFIQSMLGDKSFDESVNELREKSEKSKLDEYILFIIDSESILEREKIIVLLAHVEALVYQVMDRERKSWEKLKKIVLENVNNLHEMKIKNYAMILLAGIVYIIFSNTDNYKKEIDKRIPFRNFILHRGMLSYSDEEINSVYNLLVYFIAEISVLEKSCSESYTYPLEVEFDPLGNIE